MAEAPPLGNAPGGSRAWSAPALVAHPAGVAAPDLPALALPRWDAALEAFLAESSSNSAATAVNPSPAPAPASEPDELDLGPDPLWWAGAAVALWGLWELRSRRSDRDRFLGKAAPIELNPGDGLRR
jgi:hypothetical protein